MCVLVCTHAKKYLKIPVLAEPVRLGWQVAVDDIALLVLKTPGRDNNYIAFPYPGALLDLPLDSAHAGNPIVAPDPDMVCPHHEVSECKLLIGPFLGKTDTDDRRPVRIYCVWIYIIFVIGSNSDNSFFIYLTLRTMKVCIV